MTKTKAADQMTLEELDAALVAAEEAVSGAVAHKRELGAARQVLLSRQRAQDQLHAMSDTERDALRDALRAGDATVTVPRLTVGHTIGEGTA